MDNLVKICGLTQENDVEAAILNGANFLGFIVECKSPRSLSVEKAAHLALPPKNLIKRVAVTVNADDNLLAKICTVIQPDMLQLHGDETPERVRNIKSFTGLPIIKAIPIQTHEDLVSARTYEGAADYLLLDAKPPQNSEQRGGHGIRFDWTILDKFFTTLPYILAGGLNHENIQAAMQNTRAKIFDVSSGIEASAGLKDHALIEEFMQKVRNKPKGKIYE